jgi:hypothetical protein
MLARLRSVLPSSSAVSTSIEVVGLSAFGTGVWLQFGDAVGLIVSGVVAVLYGVALGMGPKT